MYKLLVIGSVALFIATGLMAASWKQNAYPQMPKDATYDFFIPKSCAHVNIESWSKGHQQFKTDVRAFLNMRREIMACGGRVELATRK